MPREAASCVGNPLPGMPRQTLNEKYKWARGLMDQKLYDAALPELREVAAQDPGYPGINLDLSSALLQQKRTAEAKQAADQQISISECLSQLSPDALDAYCRAEYPVAESSACRPRLTQIRQSAELQAALVHLELGHDVGVTPAPSTADTSAPAPLPASLPAPKKLHVAEKETPGLADEADDPALELPRAAPRPRKTIANTPSRPAERKPSGDRSLIDGAGTDSTLGAYSRPQ